MRVLVALLVLTFSGVSYAAELDLTPYVEYKNELKYKGSEFQDDIHHVRFGAQVGRFYGEIGPMSSDLGIGTSGEVGYKFKFNDRVTLKGKWEGTHNDRNGPDLHHKLETELRVTF